MSLLTTIEPSIHELQAEFHIKAALEREEETSHSTSDISTYVSRHTHCLLDPIYMHA